ncbi:MAG TPA: esterase-like activity of phytase family protein [Leptolyngbyaceae cyanobacterium M65_K2018_010]|nr:esterase-like activity of phytase family protein [Leptolyngbyaceae cyanobacterium M65_K2018_010]
MGLLLIWGLTSCALPQIKAEERLFLPVTVDLLDVYTLPRQEFQGTTVGGLSALAYDRSRDRFLALSDDRGQFGPPRLYELAITLDSTGSQPPRFDSITIEQVTPLLDSEGQPYPPGSLDPEGLALSPRNTLLISSEGDERVNAPPLLGEFDRPSGQVMTSFRIPNRFLPDDGESPTQGVRNNLSFESLAVNAAPGAVGQTEPFRLFVATESALLQDYEADPAQPLYCRFLHYLIGTDQSTLIAEHAYPLDLEPAGAVSHGLTELLVLDQGGHFLALERSYGLRGFAVKLFQLATGGATDISTVTSLKGGLEGLSPIRKQLVLDFAIAPFTVDNLEGMALGPRLPDGSQSLILISDNNFDGDRPTQLVLLRLGMA